MTISWSFPIIHLQNSMLEQIWDHNMTKWAVTWDFQQCGMCDQQRLRPACTYAQSDQSLCLMLEYKATDRMAFGVSKHKRRLHRLIWVYTFQNATLLEITCCGSCYIQICVITRHVMKGLNCIYLYIILFVSLSKIDHVIHGKKTWRSMFKISYRVVHILKKSKYIFN